MVNWRRLACVGERAALPNFGRYTSCISGCVAAAAAKAASCELRPGCQILRELRQLQILSARASCQILKAAAAANILLLLFPFYYITILMQLQLYEAVKF